eukprot:254778_1
MFQRTLQNETVFWNEKDEGTRIIIDSLHQLIDKKFPKPVEEQSIDSIFKTVLDPLFDNKQLQVMESELWRYSTRYGGQLFDYFCSSINIIAINNYTKLPLKLKNTLLYKINDKDVDQKFSLIPITTVFPNLCELIFTEINMYQMIKLLEIYINAVLCYINSPNEKMKEIRFQSVSQEHKQENAPLRMVVEKYYDAFKEHGWEFRYKFEVVTNFTHNIMFVNQNNNKPNVISIV